MSVIFTSKDISKKLKLGKSRVREISKELEKEGHFFTKNQDTRIYTQEDFELFRMIIENYHMNQTQSLTESVQFILNNKINQMNETNQLEGTVLNENIIEENTVTFISDHIQSTNEDNLLNKEFNEISTEKNVLEDNNHLSLNQVELESANKLDGNNDLQINFENENHDKEINTLDHPIYLDENIKKNNVLQDTPQIEPMNELVESQYSPLINEDIEVADHFSVTSLEDTPTHTEEEVPKEIASTDQSNSNQIMFEEFMSQITSLANQNEKILLQNQTLIQQNVEKDHKLEKILNSVEEKSEELQDLATVIEEKDEKLEQMFEEIQQREVSRDAQLMRVIREMQETKKMVAASKEKAWKNTLKSFFIKPKSVK